MARNSSSWAQKPGSTSARSRRRRPPPCFAWRLRRAFSTRMRRMASAAAAKKWPRLFQCWAWSTSTSRKDQELISFPEWPVWPGYCYNSVAPLPSLLERVCLMRYPSAVEHQMQNFFSSLSEKDRRRYAAVEAAKLGHGGQEYIAQLFALDPKTVRRGLDELDRLPDEHPQRVRKKGVDAGAAATSSPTSNRPSATS